MKYYGLLLLVLSCLVASVFVEGERLFQSEFFFVAYAAMGLALIIGSKKEESLRVDVGLGLILIFAVGFLSTTIITQMMRSGEIITLPFKVAILASLDYAAIGFLRLGREIRDMKRVTGDGRYEIG
ncbi:MAG: hypothetical protein V1813_01180 [Candidatus Aenigmatarchaeota archaeon]